MSTSELDTMAILREAATRTNFLPRFEFVGTLQLKDANKATTASSRPISATVVGREKVEKIITYNGGVMYRVETYIQDPGRMSPARQLPNARQHEGLTGPELIVTDMLSENYANSLEYSPQEQGTMHPIHLQPNEAYVLQTT